MDIINIYAPDGADTHIFQIANTSLIIKHYLGSTRNEALKWAEHEGHVKNRSRAHVKQVNIDELKRADEKFASSVAKALSSKVQGRVRNQNGFAVVESNGAIFTPLSVVG